MLNSELENIIETPFKINIELQFKIFKILHFCFTIILSPDKEKTFYCMLNVNLADFFQNKKRILGFYPSFVSRDLPGSLLIVYSLPELYVILKILC